MGSHMYASDLPVHKLHVRRNNLDFRLLNIDFEQVNAIEW